MTSINKRTKENVPAVFTQLCLDAPSPESGCAFLHRHAPPGVFFLSSHGETCPLPHSQLCADPLRIRVNAGAFPDVTPPPLREVNPRMSSPASGTQGGHGDRDTQGTARVSSTGGAERDRAKTTAADWAD